MPPRKAPLPQKKSKHEFVAPVKAKSTKSALDVVLQEAVAAIASRDVQLDVPEPVPAPVVVPVVEEVRPVVPTEAPKQVVPVPAVPVPAASTTPSAAKPAPKPAAPVSAVLSKPDPVQVCVDSVFRKLVPKLPREKLVAGDFVSVTVAAVGLVQELRIKGPDKKVILMRVMRKLLEGDAHLSSSFRGTADAFLMSQLSPLVDSLVLVANNPMAIGKSAHTSCCGLF